MKTIILVDSCCDLPTTYIKDNKAYIDVIGMPVAIGNKEYFDDLGQTFSHDDLYTILRSGLKPSTSQINSYRFLEKYKRHIKNGYKIIYIGLSKEMSATNRNAFKAIKMLKKECPEACVRVLESTSASLGQGLLALKAVELIKAGKTTDEVYKWLRDHQNQVQHWFAVDDLNHLRKGGRINGSQAIVGSLLNVKPILTVDTTGILKPFVKVKGRKKSLQYLIDKFVELYQADLFDQVILGHGDAYEEALFLKATLSKAVPDVKVMITELSATIAAHVGPGMLAIGFMGTPRNE